MVTASHNPPRYNGFKMVSGKRSLHGPDIQKLADYMESIPFVMPAGAGEQGDIFAGHSRLLRLQAYIGIQL